MINRTGKHSVDLIKLEREILEHHGTKKLLQAEQRDHILLKQQYAEQQLIIEMYRDAYTEPKK